MPDYIARLKDDLRELFEKHIKENKGKPLFASDIKNDKEREKWKEKQLKQWDARHEILRRLVELGDREKEEIQDNDFGDYYEYLFFRPLELRQRWLTKEGRDFLNVIIPELRKWKNIWDPERRDKVLSGLDFSFYCIRNLSTLDLKWADLHRARLSWAKLQGDNLSNANLQGADLLAANLQGTDLSDAELQGANFDYTVIAGPVLKSNGPEADNAGTGQAIQEIDDRSADFTRVEFSHEWRGPRWIASVAWLLHLGKKKLAWQESGEVPKTRNSLITRLSQVLRAKWNRFVEYKQWYSGRPTTFINVNTSRMDGSKNPGLKRYIEDEQYIENFKEKHRVIYWLWAMSSDCGRCLSLWAFWSIVIAGIFGFLYAGYDWMPQDGQAECVLCPELTIDYTAETTVRDPVTGLKEPLREKTWFTPYYYSIVTFTTLGFGDIKPRNLSAEILLTSEVVLGYFFLGGLVAILASKLARRA